MHNPDADAPFFNDVPPVVVALAILLAAIELVFQAGSAGLIGGPGAVNWRLGMAERFGFFNSAAQWMWQTGQFPFEHMQRFVTHVFFHRSGTSTLFSVVFLLALGKFVGERVATWVLLTVFFGSTMLTALFQAILFGPQMLLLGAGAATYGLIGALTWLLFAQARAVGADPRQAFSLAGALALIHLVFYLIFGGNTWFESLGGFVFGFGLTALLCPAPGRGVGYWLDRTRTRG